MRVKIGDLRMIIREELSRMHEEAVTEDPGYLKGILQGIIGVLDKYITARDELTDPSLKPSVPQPNDKIARFIAQLSEWPPDSGVQKIIGHLQSHLDDPTEEVAVDAPAEAGGMSETMAPIDLALAAAQEALQSLVASEGVPA
jgi:hypothetical protein